jgi:hypothetical protein
MVWIRCYNRSKEQNLIKQNRACVQWICIIYGGSIWAIHFRSIGLQWLSQRIVAMIAKTSQPSHTGFEVSRATGGAQNEHCWHKNGARTVRGAALHDGGHGRRRSGGQSSNLSAAPYDHYMCWPSFFSTSLSLSFLLREDNIVSS